jgi:pimeloyl-ACP methyl ester carboxylesterase
MSIAFPRFCAGLILLVIFVTGAGIPAGDQAPVCPPIGENLEIGPWHYLGPFSIGAREGIIGLVDNPGDLRPSESERFPSILVQGGYVGWRRAEVDSSGYVHIEFEDVRWDTLMDIYGYPALLNGCYAYGEVTCPERGRTLIITERVGSFLLNGRLQLGEPYGHGYTRVPVILQQGINRLVLSLTGYAGHRFRFEILPPPTPVITVNDFTVPDIIEGETGSFWIGVPLLNTTPDWIHDLRLEIVGGLYTRPAEKAVSGLAPLAIKKVPIRIELIHPSRDTDEIEVPLALRAGGHTFSDTITLRVRSAEASFRRTFISSIDSSCQYYAVLPPSEFDSEKEYGLILSLHGANVQAHGQADAYKAKPWAFVAAPTNRRRYGFDWQDWGRLDALEVLEHVKASYPIDPDRVYLTGHSMGGHGAWHVGLTHPDHFAALAPAAGWTSFELYIPWFLQRAYVHGEPRAIAIRDMALRQDWPVRFVENALNLPAFILQGGADDNVPPVHARMFVKRFEELGYPYTYKEDPGKGHWYNIDSLGVACVDDPDLISFLQDKVRDPLPHHVAFRTTNIGHAGSSYWLDIAQQERLYHESAIDAHIGGSEVHVTTSNVRAFRLRLAGDLVPEGPISIVVDGDLIRLDHTEVGLITFSKRAGEFRLGAAHGQRTFKTAERHGPIKQAYFSPFVLVYGTRGDIGTTDLLLHQARLEAFQWWRRANGLVEILPDTAVTRRTIETRNLILFGGPDVNLITSRVDRFLPIRLIDGGLYLDDKLIMGDDLAAKFVYPNPLNPEKLVVVHEGTGTEGQALSTWFRTLYAGAGLPDFVVFDGRVKGVGWGGMVAAGFFDSEWQVDENLMYIEGSRW